jgi:hypothetical protein
MDEGAGSMGSFDIVRRPGARSIDWGGVVIGSILSSRWAVGNVAVVSKVSVDEGVDSRGGLGIDEGVVGRDGFNVDCVLDIDEGIVGGCNVDDGVGNRGDLDVDEGVVGEDGLNVDEGVGSRDSHGSGRRRKEAI